MCHLQVHGVQRIKTIIQADGVIRPLRSIFTKSLFRGGRSRFRIMQLYFLLQCWRLVMWYIRCCWFNGRTYANRPKIWIFICWSLCFNGLCFIYGRWFRFNCCRFSGPSKVGLCAHWVGRFKTDAYATPGCKVEDKLAWMYLASLKETFRSILILTIACCLFHSGHCLEYARWAQEQFAHLGSDSGQCLCGLPDHNEHKQACDCSCFVHDRTFGIESTAEGLV
jgi:hypothetical protein